MDAVVAPLFEVVALNWEPPNANAFDALLITSANAARLAGEGLSALRHLPVYAVGETSAEAARKAGLSVTYVGTAGVDALGAHLPDGTKVLHLAGADHVALPGATAIAVYKSQALSPAAELRDLAGQVAAVHSERAGAQLRAACEGLGINKATVRVAAISARAAAALGPGWARVEIADEPREAALLALAARLCHTGDQ
jgi:uroporphyrinogen-III synthase